MVAARLWSSWSKTLLALSIHVAHFIVNALKKHSCKVTAGGEAKSACIEIGSILRAGTQCGVRESNLQFAAPAL